MLICLCTYKGGCPYGKANAAGEAKDQDEHRNRGWVAATAEVRGPGRTDGRERAPLPSGRGVPQGPKRSSAMITERQRYGSRGQGSLIKYDDSPNWFSCYYVRGTEHRESTGTPDLKLARRFHRRKLDEVAGDRQGLKKYLAPMAQRVQLGELLDTLEADYRLRSVKSSAQVQSHLKPIRAHFGDWRAVDITAEAVDAYIEARLDADKARATINRETQLLGQALRLALERHRITTIPSIRHLPESNARQGFFEAAEFEALVAALPEYLRDFARFAYLTGWRRGEILSLQWADVDLKGGAIRLRSEHSKNGHGRVVMLGGDLETLMQRRA